MVHLITGRAGRCKKDDERELYSAESILLIYFSQRIAIYLFTNGIQQQKSVLCP